MAPQITPMTSAYERILLTQGPQVDIYVGPEKKHYKIPKRLLCANSNYFTACFEGGFVEAKAQQLELNEDKVNEWEILLEFMFSGKVKKNKLSFPESNTADQQLQSCMGFIEYTDKYNLGGACMAIHDSLMECLEVLVENDTIDKYLKGSDIELVFRAAPEESQIRKLIVQAAMACASSRFKDQEKRCDGFAAEVLAQLRGGEHHTTWSNPLMDENTRDRYS